MIDVIETQWTNKGHEMERMTLRMKDGILKLKNQKPQRKIIVYVLV